jgi:amino acid transporter
MNDKKFGTFLGVITPNVTIMFGVILFLRLGLITANVGLPTMLTIIAISTLLILITCLSISSIISSMHTIGSGGVYYVVSRTLGIEIGGALGIVIFLSQILLISFTANAFSYLLESIYPNINVRVVEVLTITGLATFSSYSANITLKLQVVILAIILAAVGAVFLGDANNIAIIESAKPFYTNMGFWFAFSMFFPALTGIEIGMSLSGTLRNPVKSLLSGNIISLCLVSVVYAALSVFIFYNVPLSALASDPFVLTKYSCSKAIMLVGISTAALSGTIGALIGGPRTLQIMAEDGIMPKFLADVYGKYNEPRYALLGTTIVSIIISITTDLEQIIPVLTMNCLITYGLLNFISGINTLMNTANWRPKFKTHYLISFSGLAMVIIFML